MTRRWMAAWLVTAAVVPLLSGCSPRGGTSIVATFDDIGDLQTRGSVQVADVRVGQIGKITLTKDFHARVHLTLNHGVHVPRDSSALLRTTSLLGEKFIELRPNGDPTAQPYFRNGDTIPRAHTTEAPELEFVAEEAVTALGAVVASDIGTLVQTSAEAFGGRAPVLRSLINELSTISATFASRTNEIGRIIDGFDATAAALAGGKGEIDGLLVNLADTTRILADNRDRAVNALAQLSRLAAVQNEVLAKYRSDIDRQIKQVDAIVGVAVGQTSELSLLVDWLQKFAVAVPKVIPGDFTQVYAWIVPAQLDPRVGT
ncbi:MAG TPA: MCE family protein [Acidimicrobiales bacterium]|nr:MCE family protein [Acidimicrobiales bacterium]